MKENSGWIKIYRKVEETSFYRRPLVVALFIHLLIRANREDKNIVWNREELLVKSGSLVTGRKALSTETGISEQSVRTCLDILKSTSTITIKAYSKFSVISINNWSKYQESTSKLTNYQPATNQQLTTNKNNKNIRIKEDIYISPEKIKEIATNYRISETSVSEVYQDLILYCKSKGKTYKNYEAALMGWLRRKMGEGKIKRIINTLPVVDDLTPEERQVNLKRIEEIKSRYANKLHLR